MTPGGAPGLSGTIIYSQRPAHEVIPSLDEPFSTVAEAGRWTSAFYSCDAMGWDRADLAGALACGGGLPAVVALVVGSDLARVSAAGPDGAGWELFVNPQAAVEHRGFVPADYDRSLPGRAEAAARWTVDVTGAAVTSRDVLDVVDRGYVFAEEGVFELVGLLGIAALPR